MNNKLYYQLMLYPILMILLVSIFLSIYNIYKYKQNYIILAQELTQRYENNHIKKSTEIVEETIKRVELHNSIMQKNLKDRISHKVNTTISIMDNLYLKYHKSLTQQEMKRLLLDIVESIKFEDKNGYFFVHDLNTKKVLSHKQIPSLVDKDIKNITDLNGKKLVLSKQEILKNKKFAYQTVYFNKPNDVTKKYPKLVYFTKFKPYNWIIGTGEYTDKIKNETQEILLNKIKYIEKNLTRDIFILKVAGKLENKNISVIYSKELKDKVKKDFPTYLKNTIFTNDFIKTINDKKKGYKKYKIKKFNQKVPKEKYSYFSFYKPWGWIIGSGKFNEDIQSLLNEKKKELNNKLREDIINILIVTFVLLLILTLTSYYLNNKIIKIIKEYETNTKLQNEELTNEVKKQMTQILKKDLHLVQKSKNEELGEMMAMITHQWRQPLNIINSIMAKLYKDNLSEDLNNKKISEYIDKVEDLTQFMSMTIKDFSQFYTPSIKNEYFSISSSINKVLNIIFSKYSIFTKPIISIDEQTDKKQFGLEANFQQVVLVIINNAMENIKNNSIINPELSITIKDIGNKILIDFKDNGGGIDLEVIDTLFNEYTSTKDGNLRGIGLYMSKLIISNSFNGTIYAKNDDMGAIFTVELANEQA